MFRNVETQLKAWKNSVNRKPLLLYGARQVGKTYTLLQFGEECFENFVYINLETARGYQELFQNNLQPAHLLRLLEGTNGKEIKPQKTLLILDEIQSCPSALTSLKYFCEEAPEYCVAAAGSLLGVALQRENFSFPVGKVHSITMYPLDFEEFLLANDQQFLAEQIRQAYAGCEPLPELLHNKALEFYKYYLVVGGMPSAVQEFIKQGKLLIGNEQQEILCNYTGDMAKYATPAESVRIKAAFDTIPAQLAKDNKKFQYKLIQRGATSSYFGVALDWLEQSGIVLKCWHTEQGTSPVEVYKDLSAFKLYMSDVGLLLAKSGISLGSVLLDAGNTFMGAVTENYLAQQLAARGHKLYYWAPGDSTAEVDFLLESAQGPVPVECKSGTHNRSRSLGIFCRRYAPSHAIRFSAENFYRTANVECLPLYAAFCLEV